jgi:hypothetical protein
VKHNMVSGLQVIFIKEPSRLSTGNLVPFVDFVPFRFRGARTGSRASMTSSKVESSFRFQAPTIGHPSVICPEIK